MKKPTQKIEERNLGCKATKLLFPILSLWGAFSLTSCLMTKAEGDRITYRVSQMEEEFSKVQMLRHDLETLLDEQVKSLFQKVALIDQQLSNLKQSVLNENEENKDLVRELQRLRGELETAQRAFMEIKNNSSLSAASESSVLKIPASKEAHFYMAQKNFEEKKFENALGLLTKFVDTYKNEDIFSAKAYFMLGQLYDQSLTKSSKNDVESHKKQALVYYKNALSTKDPKLLEDTLFNLGVLLKNMGNNNAAIKAFTQVLEKKGKHAEKAKEELAKLQK